jgi:hypothetical protein
MATDEQGLQDAYEKARDAQAENPTPRGAEKMQEAAAAFQAARSKRKQAEADDPDHPRQHLGVTTTEA